MPQQTNLNISPYYDDFDRTKNFHRVLFKPGFPVQARELTTMQSILQNQVEQFGSHIFKEGSVVVPGGITFDPEYFAVQLDGTHLGTDVEVYLGALKGKKIKGQSSGVVARVINCVTASESDNNNPTIYVKYVSPGPSGSFDFFDNSELLILEDTVSYGNTTLNLGSSIASTITVDACLTGSAASIASGVYFVRGNFVRVNEQTLILDQYTNNSTYRVGLQVVESEVAAKEDTSLYDNAKGFSNFAAPGADRLKIELVLSKKPITDFDDTDFIEVVRVREGTIEKENNNNSQYNIILDYLAKRTHDESGDYALKPFIVDVQESLNDRQGSGGVYFEDEITREGREPNEDITAIKVSPGTAYVKGYEFSTEGEIIDCPKARFSTEEFIEQSFTFRLGNKLVVQDVNGNPTQGSKIDLQSGISSSIIGSAKVYNFALSDAKYKDNSTEFDLHLFDVQLFNTIELSDNTTWPKSVTIEGAESGARGITIAAGTASSSVTVQNVSGRFLDGEQIVFTNDYNLTRSADKVIRYDINNVENLSQTGFYAKKKLFNILPVGFDKTDPVQIATNGTVTCPGKTFEVFKPNQIITYTVPAASLPSRNVVTEVAADGSTMKLAALTSVPQIYNGALPSGTFTGAIFLGQQQLSQEDKSGLYVPLPKAPISEVDLTDAEILLSAQVTNESTDANGVLVVNTSALSINDVTFVSFDQERYQVTYSDGTIATIDDSQVVVTSDTLTINNLEFSETGIEVNVTVVKSNIRSKVKEFKKSQSVSITRSSNAASGSNSNISLNDGLTNSALYGLRVQDADISLNCPDAVNVVCIYESLDANAPIFDKLAFTSTDPIFQNAIVGENIIGETSNAVARIVEVDAGNSNISIVYQTIDKFALLENLTFSESNSTAVLQNIINGKFKDITDSYVLDKGQKEQYYGYSFISRLNDNYIPTKQITVIFDKYDIPSTDTGDVFTVASYDPERFSKDVPEIGIGLKRATDTLDFRPRVAAYDPATAVYSPFDPWNREGILSSARTLTPNESSKFKFKHYLARMDKLILKPGDGMVLLQGVDQEVPQPPADQPDSMTIATIVWPPYTFDVEDVQVFSVDNRRYTMRDIGEIEDRVVHLENVTTLSFLEQKIENLQIKDADGLDRFKSGFFADSFKSRDLTDPKSPVEIDIEKGMMMPLKDFNSIDVNPVPSSEVPPEQLDNGEDYALLDENTQKTGRMVSLKYEEVTMVEQTFATRVENLNPFLVHDYTGTLKLNPTSDNWINTVNTSGVTRNKTIRRQNVDTRVSLTEVNGGFGEDALALRSRDSVQRVERDDITSRNTFIQSETFDPFIRSRNIEYTASGLRPNSRYYQFFDDQGNVDVVPKIIGVDNVVGAFSVGETITALVNGETYRFRLCRPDHKKGPFAAPTKTYQANPLDINETLPTAYSQGSTVINIDTAALAQSAQGDFFGFLPIGTVVAGQTSGAQATIRNLTLNSDGFGDLIAAMWIRDPYSTPEPLAKIRSGEREVKVTTDNNNIEDIRGGTTISDASAIFSARGTTRIIQTDVSVTTLQTTTIERDVTITFTNRTTPPPPPPPAPVIINRTTTIVREVQVAVPTPAPPRGRRSRWRRRNRWQRRIRRIRRNRRRGRRGRRGGRDPLAQSFRVGEEGAYVTSVDIFFAEVEDPAVPWWVEIRTMEVGLPTEQLVSPDARVDLDASEALVSSDASIATNIAFPCPIYLEPDTEYCFVVGSPFNTYEVFTAEMGQTALNAQELPAAAGNVYSNQFSVGSIFKSQNSSTWTPCQFEDMCFKLYRANFTAEDAIITFQNPPIRANNGILPALNKNPIHTLPKKATLGITTTTNAGLIGTVFTVGRTIGDASATYRSAKIESTGGPVDGVLGINSFGTNYGTPNNNAINTFTITGKGAGLTLHSVTVGTGASPITGVAVSATGSGYQVGDIVGIVTADMSGSGSGCRLGINSVGGLDTLFLTNIQAEEFTAGNSVTYNHSAGTVIDSTLDVITYDATGSFFTGEYAKVDCFNHGMYSSGNKVVISGATPDTLPTVTSTIVNSTTSAIAVGDSTGFDVFEGVLVSAANTGYAIINSEVISYTAVGINTLSGIVRGIDNTQAINHAQGSTIQKYEISGVALNKINKTHDVQALERNMDSFLIKIDREGRSVDISGVSQPQLSFNSDAFVGGEHVHSTRNIMFDSVTPLMDVLTPTGTDEADMVMRTVSGTSVDGNEVSFSDQGFEEVILNKETKLANTRLLASEVNENNRLTNMFRNKSITARMFISNGGNEFSSPMVCLDTAAFTFTSNRINKPIEEDNYAHDPRVNRLTGDPHTSYYQSKVISIKNPATSLKVIVDAYRPQDSDFRVLYSLVRPDVSEEDQKFVLFPGYKNNIDTTGDGFGDTAIDPNKNDGRPDKFIASSDKFVEYQFTVNEVEPFTGFVIKIVMNGTDTARVPIIKNIRALALA